MKPTDNPSSSTDLAKFIPISELAAWRETLPSGQRLVMTNGCFDLLHAGHVRYLRQAKSLGHLLLVALNSDASVRSLKGPSRPINQEMDRAEVLCALEAVDAVTLFDTVRCDAVVRLARPHAYAKGGDYTPEALDPDERAALAEVGTEIHILPLVPGRSTTAIVQKMATA
jgi:rfaE bifunctional protein nucleotidyltransferase chain/domain